MWERRELGRNTEEGLTRSLTSVHDRRGRPGSCPLLDPDSRRVVPCETMPCVRAQVVRPGSGMADCG